MVILLGQSCERDDCKGGSGGNVTVIARLYHQDKLIGSGQSYPDTVFVKYDTHESPGSKTESYDAQFIGKAGEDHVNVTGLKCGEYYFFGTGLDTVSSPGSAFRVTGGISFSTEKENGEQIFTLPVSE